MVGIIMSVKAELKVQTWGNSLAVRIPSAVARQARLLSGQPVTIEASDGVVVVKPLRRLPRLTLRQKLKAFDPKAHGGEIMAAKPVGKEAY
jgi:antitoxin MazE